MRFFWSLLPEGEAHNLYVWRFFICLSFPLFGIYNLQIWLDLDPRRFLHRENKNFLPRAGGTVHVDQLRVDLAATVIKQKAIHALQHVHVYVTCIMPYLMYFFSKNLSFFFIILQGHFQCKKKS